MRIKEGLIIKLVGDEYVLIDSGKISPKFNGMIKLNETSKYIIDLLSLEDMSFSSLVDKLLAYYEIDKDTLIKTIKPLLNELSKEKILLNYNEL